MCDYSLQNIKSRAAKVGDKLTTRNFGTGTRGFAASEDASLAVCVLPGTELSFSNEVTCQSTGLFTWRNKSDEAHDGDLSPSQQAKGRRASRCFGISRWSGRTLDVPL